MTRAEMMQRLEAAERAPRKTLDLVCTRCGHEQSVTSITADKIRGRWTFYFGSSRDFCDKCDGPMKEITQ